MENIKNRMLEAIFTITGGRDENVKAAEKCAAIAEEEMIELLEWITAKDCKYAIMNGGTPEFEKDLRFAGQSEDDDKTIKELLDIYKKEKGL